MENLEIKEKERQCISMCIHKFWNLPDDVEIKNRDEKYERCLISCEICS
jgi:hypothetical protein